MLATRKILLFVAVLASLASSAFGQGVFLTGVGAVNRSMGGAATAAPIDAMGALHWNPATISGLQSRQTHTKSFVVQGLGQDNRYSNL
ncbi:MAG: hypothetical protein O3C40_20120, partial [Planctomycetota bacterium]|nr:hypothetical protein [Planctomycetota bacterium]